MSYIPSDKRWSENVPPWLTGFHILDNPKSTKQYSVNFLIKGIFCAEQILIWDITKLEQNFPFPKVKMFQDFRIIKVRMILLGSKTIEGFFNVISSSVHLWNNTQKAWMTLYLYILN